MLLISSKPSQYNASAMFLNYYCIFICKCVYVYLQFKELSDPKKCKQRLQRDKSNNETKIAKRQILHKDKDCKEIYAAQRHILQKAKDFNDSLLIFLLEILFRIYAWVYQKFRIFHNINFMSQSLVDYMLTVFSLFICIFGIPNISYSVNYSHFLQS